MKNKSILIGIAGGTGSGKTSISKELMKEYGKGEVVVIQQDSYYKDLSHIKLEERQLQNFDHPNAIDIKLFREQITTLLNGKTVQVPIYDFTIHVRSREKITISPHHVIVLEGILALHYVALRQLMNIKIYVETPADIRFIRRLSRDIKERGRTTQSVIDQYLSTVRPMHDQFVEPSKFYADIIIPEGGENKVAIDLIRTKINSILSRK
ncbi:MAG: uridine kinase [Candidatus Neomarinimicrobiota bacterium]